MQPTTIEFLTALLARCVPPEYMVEPAPRSCDKEWVWDSCDDDWSGFGEADSREQALADAWVHFHAKEAERVADQRDDANLVLAALQRAGGEMSIEDLQAQFPTWGGGGDIAPGTVIRLKAAE